MFGPIKKDEARKLEPLTDKIGIAAAGLMGAIDDIIKALKEYCTPHTPFDEIYSTLSNLNLAWHKANEEKVELGESSPIFIVVSPFRIRRIFSKGYSEEAYDYACDGMEELMVNIYYGIFIREIWNKKKRRNLQYTQF